MNADSGGRNPLRIALLDPAAPGDGYVSELARALKEAGHDPAVVSSPTAPRLVRVSEAVLCRRGFTSSLTSVPASVVALRRGDFDVAHAFSPVGAIAALAWQRRARRPVVFTFIDRVDRASVADRRLRLWALERAVGDTDALAAGSDEVRVAMRQWLAVDAPAIEAGDAQAYTRLYRALLDRRG